MKIDVTQKLLNFDNEPLMVGGERCPQCGRSAEGTAIPLTLRKVLIDALMASYKDEQKLEGEKKIERYELAKRIHDEDIVELATKEAASLQGLVNRLFGNPAVVAQAWLALEGEESAAE